MKRPLILTFTLAVGLLLLVLNTPRPYSPTRLTTNHLARLEKFQEKLTLFLKFTPQAKTNHLEYLVEKRLAELKYAVTTPGQLDLVEETASRYTTYLGNLTNYVIQHRLVGKKSELLTMYQDHSQIITELQKNYKFESGWWLAIQHDINTLKIFSDQLKNPSFQ